MGRRFPVPLESGIISFSSHGGLETGYPKSLYGDTLEAGAPVAGDFDGDGIVDVAVAITDASYGGIVALYSMEGPNHDENHHWPMKGHDNQQTGYFSPLRPNRPTNLATSQSLSGIDLRWQDNSNREVTFQIERSETGFPFTYQVIGEVPGNSPNPMSAIGLYLTEEDAIHWQLECHSGALPAFACQSNHSHARRGRGLARQRQRYLIPRFTMATLEEIVAHVIYFIDRETAAQYQRSQTLARRALWPCRLVLRLAGHYNAPRIQFV